MSDIAFSIPGWSLDRAIVEALGWTLLHFLWQGAAVAAALALCDALLSHARAQTRYMMGCAALLAMLALPVATFLSMDPAPLRTTHPGGDGRPHATVFRTLTPRPSGVGRAHLAVQRAIAPANRLIATDRTPWHPVRSGLRSLRERISASALLPWFVGLWALGVVVLSLRLLGGWWLVMRLGRSTQNIPIEAWQETLAGLARRMRVSRPVRLVRSALVTVPTAIGWLRPVILLPASTLTGLAPRQIEAILAHELAHIRRHDYLINLVQSVIETLLFYHPAVWWVSRRIREERELCCDDLAVQASGDAVTYAHALAELERMRGEGMRMALAASGGSLVDRIARLTGASRSPHLFATRGLAWALIASLVAIGGAAGGAVRMPDRAPMSVRSMNRVAVKALAMAPQALSMAPKAAAEMATRAVAMAQQVVPPVPAVAVVLAAAQVPPVTSCEETPRPDASRDEASSVGLAPEDPAPPPMTGQALREVEQRFAPEDWQRLANAGVSPRYVLNLTRAGYEDLSVDELIALAQHGVTSSYAGKMRRMLGDPSVDDLVRLASHGVTSEYTRAMRQQLGDVTVDDLIQLASHGISSEYVAGMRELDLDDLTTDDLIHLANSGVTLEWFASLRWMGYTDLSVDRAIELRNAGVTPDYAASLRMLQRHRLSLDELRTLRNQGVDVEYAATLMGLLRKDLDVEQLVRLRNQGITVEFVAAMNALGRSELTADELIELHQQGVEPEFVAALAAVGYGRLDAGDLVRLRQGGVDADFVMEVREAGQGTPSVDELIRMRQNGIPPARVTP